jgi:hypothetical protein
VSAWERRPDLDADDVAIFNYLSEHQALDNWRHEGRKTTWSQESGQDVLRALYDNERNKKEVWVWTGTC